MSSDPATLDLGWPPLDYQFAWTWLLPLESDDSLQIVGFSPEEEAFLRSGLAVAGDRARNRVLLVNGDVCSPHQLEAGILLEARCVSVVGSGASVARWRRALRGTRIAAEYGFLPARAARLVVPLRSGAIARRALLLHRPGRRVTRAFVTLARALSFIGLRFHLRRRTLFVSVRSGCVTPTGARTSGLSEHHVGAATDYALYLGTPDPSRKTVAFLLAGGVPTLIAKVAERDLAKEGLSREIAALEQLRGTSLERFLPTCVGATRDSARITLLELCVERCRNTPTTRTEDTIRFLAALSRLGRRTSTLELELLRMEAAGEQRREALPNLIARWSPSTQVFRHRAHGDFAPWNCIQTPTGLVVYDWEAFKEAALAFNDAFYFCLFPARLMDRSTPPGKLVRNALDFARRVAAQGDLPGADPELHLQLWLHEMIAGDRSGFFERIARFLGWRVT